MSIGVTHRFPAYVFGFFFRRFEAKYLAAAAIQSVKMLGQLPSNCDLVTYFPLPLRRGFALASTGLTERLVLQ